MWQTDEERPQIESISEPTSEKTTINLYRGFDVNIDDLRREGSRKAFLGLEVAYISWEEIRVGLECPASV